MRAEEHQEVEIARQEFVQIPRARNLGSSCRRQLVWSISMISTSQRTMAICMAPTVGVAASRITLWTKLRSTTSPV